MTDVPVLGSTGVIQFYVDGGVYGAPVSVSAAASRTAIEAGLGPLIAVELVRCKATLLRPRNSNSNQGRT